jgi:hypothetical protein
MRRERVLVQRQQHRNELVHCPHTLQGRWRREPNTNLAAAGVTKNFFEQNFSSYKVESRVLQPNKSRRHQQAHSTRAHSVRIASGKVPGLLACARGLSKRLLRIPITNTHYTVANFFCGLGKVRP